MNTIDPQTLAQVVSEAVTAAIVAALAPQESAAPAPAAPEVPAPPKPRKPLTRAQRRAWNSKITALASHGRPAGTNAALKARWAEAQELREARVTPAKALARMGF